MAKLKLPEQLKDWKVLSTMPDKNGYPAYKVEKTEFDGTKLKAELTCIEYEGELYSSENVDLINEEAAFVKSVIGIRGISNYVDVVTDNVPSKNRIALYILTEELMTLREKTDKNPLSEGEIVDFALQMSEILDKLEQSNIFHGGINPGNVYITPDGKYKLGGFTAFEADDSLSYAAPEIKNNQQPDDTTDIYSLGLMMYAMSNGGRLPFENDGTNAEAAAEKRFASASLPAPSNGSEKLKSVIVIACQPDSKNRWKNAGNLRNALSSIKSEMPTGGAAAAAVIAPAATAFESNVFEEFDYDSFEPETEEPKEEPAHVENNDKTVLIEEPADDKTQLIDENNEIDNRVFDDYEVQTKVFNINEVNKAQSNDYGDYFEEPEKVKAEEKPADNQVSEFDGNAFYREDGEEDEPQEKEKTGRKGLIIAIIVVAALLLAALATIGVLGANNGWFNGLFGKGNSTQEATQATSQSADAAASTQPETTQKPTTKPEETTNGEAGEETQSTEPVDQIPENVIGFYYDYATLVLEAQGFKVEIASFEPSDEYDYGYVTAMSPDDGEIHESGSTITLTVSSGKKDDDSSKSDESSSDSESSEDTDGEDADSSSSAGSSANAADAAFAEGKVNTSYLSQNEVNAMSQEELNLTLNEIYARRGRIFSNSSLSAYFNAQSWYTPKYTAEEFAENVVFNSYESRNIDMIRNKQIEKGYVQ